MADRKIMVSPHFTRTAFVSGSVTQVEVFEDQVLTCVLDFARECVKCEHSGIAVLMLCCSVFEPIGQMLPRDRNKNPNHESAFCTGCEYVLGTKIAPLAVGEQLYKLLRCGLYHDGWIKPELVLWRGEDPVLKVSGTLHIDPERFHEATHAGVKRYINELKQAGKTKDAFYAHYRRLLSLVPISATENPDEASKITCWPFSPRL